MISRFRVSNLLPRRLEELGLSLPVLLRQANLPVGLFDQEKILVTTEELFALYRGIAAVSGDPAIGLKLGSEQRLERYSPVAIAALYTRSFRDAIQRLARYKQLTCPEEIRVICQGDRCAVRTPQLEAELTDRRSRLTIRDQVKQTLKPLLAGQRPTIQEVAREMSLSARTLQRRLAEAGVTFQLILEEARRELARHYLLQSSLELNETAYLLGYENANSFFRAFHHWEGTSPGQWREVQRQANGNSLVSQIEQSF
jgi:AraC-like DNA-binding protein